jgi:hypothetical protein
MIFEDIAVVKHLESPKVVGSMTDAYLFVPQVLSASSFVTHKLKN